jgi:beta-N-acetylhexosaminidase
VKQYRWHALAWILTAAVALPVADAQNGLRQAVGNTDARDIEHKEDPEYDEASLDDLTAVLQSLDLRERIAQLMMVTLQGSNRPDSSDMQLISRYIPGAVVLPSVNNPGWTAEYIASLRRSPAEIAKGIPMLIGTNIYELPRPRSAKKEFFVPTPSLMSIAAAADPEVSTRMADYLSSHLAALGFNMHLGPSLELAPTLAEARGSIHCLGSDPAFVAETSEMLMSRMEERGIVCVPTGFPGGGMNRFRGKPPVMLTPLDQLPERDLLPYARIIERGVPMVHVGTTLIVPPGGEAEPACISEYVMRKLLRQDLGFEGAVVAGPFDTNDIVVKHKIEDAVIMALEAGADMLYWNEAGQRVMKTVDDLHKAVVEGRLSQEVIDNAVMRVLRMKSNAKLVGRKMPEYAEAQKIGRKKNADAAYEIERRSITLVMNRNHTLPLNKKESVPVAITGVMGVEELHEPLEEYLKPVQRQLIRTAQHGGRIYDFEVDRLTRHARGIKTVVIICSPEVEINGQVQLVAKFKSMGMRTVVVLCGYPAALPKFGGADAILLSYSDPKGVSQSMRAVADVLVGQSAVTIMPLIEDMRITAGQQETFDVLDVVRAPAGRLPVTLEPPFMAGLAIPYDPTFTIKKAHWDFGDGDSAKKQRVEKTYKEPGRYPITLTIEDKKGWETSRTFYAVVE